MIGQVELVNKFNTYTLETLPHTILLLGDRGCGKHTLVNELSKRLNVPIKDISKDINLDVINEAMMNPFTNIYVIDTNQLNERQQNVILKFIEEPNDRTYIFLLCENKLSLIDTIINRCVPFTFKPYTKEELSQFTKETDSRIFNYCRTPGQVKSISIQKLDELETLCDNLISKLSKASITNTLSVANRFNYKDNYDKFDIDVFFELFMDKLLKSYINKNVIAKDIYFMVDSYYQTIKDSRMNRQHLMENMFLNMWETVRNG